MENGTNRLIPRSEVFAEAQRLDLAPSDDRFDRFRKAELIADLAPIGGTTQRGFTPNQKQRFFDLLSLCDKLGSKRPKASALGFWLCWYGHKDVPPRLVCDHIERALRSYLRVIRREYERRRVPYRDANDSERWRKAGMPWAKALIAEFIQPSVANGLILDILSTMVGFGLRLLFADASFEAAAQIFSGIAFLFGFKETKVETMRTLWDIARDIRRVFTTDEQISPLLNAVREMKAQNSSEILEMVQDGRLLVAVLAAVFPVYSAAGAPAVPEGSSRAKESIVRQFSPAMCSVLALTRRDAHAIETRKRLRAGEAEAALAPLNQIKVIRDLVIAHISKEPKP